MKINLRPFTIPNFVIMETPARPRQEGMVESPKFRLDELDVTDLDVLCTNFRNDVFHKAGKADPRLGMF